MESLLNNAFAPVTHHIGFLEASYADVVNWFDAWLASLSPCWESKAVSGIRQGLQALEPLWLTPYLVIETESDWTGVFAGDRSGPYSPVAYLSKAHHFRGLFVGCIPSNYDRATNRGSWGAVTFSTFAAHSPAILNNERTVQAVNDCGKWRFVASGPVYPFEEMEQYELRRIKDRFTPDMLSRYCAALGIRVFDDSFYGPAATLFRRTDTVPPGAKIERYEDMQRQLRVD